MASIHEGLERVLRPLLDGFKSTELATQWAQRDPAALKLVDELLAKGGLNMDAVLAETLGVKIDQVVTIKDMISNHEKRFAAALREIEHHREELAEPVRAVKEARMPSSKTSGVILSMGDWHDERAKASGQLRQCASEHGAQDGQRQEAICSQCPAAWPQCIGATGPVFGPLAEKHLEEFARGFAGPSPSPAVLFHARRAAEAHVDLQRVRACRDSLIEQALADPSFVGVKADELRLRSSIRWLELSPHRSLAYLYPKPLEGPEDRRPSLPI